jgi:hypothetical protein
MVKKLEYRIAWNDVFIRSDSMYKLIRFLILAGLLLVSLPIISVVLIPIKGVDYIWFHYLKK